MLVNMLKVYRHFIFLGKICHHFIAVELREVWVKVRGEVPGREGYSDQTQ